MNGPFDSDPHLFKAPEFASIVEEAIHFFSNSPIQEVHSTYHMNIRGVYGLYYFGDYELYAPIAERNRAKSDQPIYVGKAVSSGKRTGQSRNQDTGNVLSRLWEHTQSINATK